MSYFDVFLAAATGGLIVLIWFKIRFASFRQHALSILKAAEQEAAKKISSCTSELQKLEAEHERKLQQKNFELASREQQLAQQSRHIAQESDRIKKETVSLETLRQLEQSLKQKEILAAKTLEQISGFSREEARRELFLSLREELNDELEREKKRQQALLETDCQARATSTLFSAIERKAQSLSRETFLSEIPLKNEQCIPKIIGKEGRNIQTLQGLLGGTIVLEEHPPRLLLHAHDKRNRVLIEKTLERLFETEKITPITIREYYDRCSVEMDRYEEELGRQALTKCYEEPFLSPECFKALGSLFFRSSLGQNTLAHSIEVSELMHIMAKEMGLLPKRAELMGLLHDIGKALPKEWGSSHATAGKRFLQHHKFDPIIVNAVASHHGEEQPLTDEARLLPICDRISAELPGIRDHKNPAFLSLVRECEKLSLQVPGVQSAWAHYAGNHVELIIRHTSSANEDIERSIHKSLESGKNSLPVHLTILCS